MRASILVRLSGSRRCPCWMMTPLKRCTSAYTPRNMPCIPNALRRWPAARLPFGAGAWFGAPPKKKIALHRGLWHILHFARVELIGEAIFAPSCQRAALQHEEEAGVTVWAAQGQFAACEHREEGEGRVQHCRQQPVLHSLCGR